MNKREEDFGFPEEPSIEAAARSTDADGKTEAVAESFPSAGATRFMDCTSTVAKSSTTEEASTHNPFTKEFPLLDSTCTESAEVEEEAFAASHTHKEQKPGTLMGTLE